MLTIDPSLLSTQHLTPIFYFFFLVWVKWDIFTNVLDFFFLVVS